MGNPSRHAADSLPPFAAAARGPRQAPARRRRTATKAGARVRETVLDNGLRVLTAARRSDPVVAVMTYYRVGARNESEREAGFSHFLEHMMFKGSRRFGKGEVDRLTTELGGSNNAFTSYDHTAYWFELASDRWERALEMEADRMRHLTLDPGEFESERNVVLEELAMGRDDPWRTLGERVQELVFARHPYRRPIIGYPDSLRAAGRDDLRDYYRRFYHPGNAVLVLCGDLDARDALARVERHFGRIPAGPAFEAADPFRPAPEEPWGEQRLRTTWDDPGRRLCMAWPTVPVGHEDDDALDVVATVLAGGRLSRLHRRLVLEEGLATSVTASNDTRVEAGVFWLFAECAQGVEQAALEAAVDEELARLAQETPRAAEMRRVRSMLIASEAFDAETASDLAEQLGSFAVDADWRLAVDAVERVRAVTPRRARDAAARLLRPERRVVAWSEPRPAAHGRRAATGGRRRGGGR